VLFDIFLECSISIIAEGFQLLRWGNCLVHGDVFARPSDESLRIAVFPGGEFDRKLRVREARIATLDGGVLDRVSCFVKNVDALLECLSSTRNSCCQKDLVQIGLPYVGEVQTSSFPLTCCFYITSDGSYERRI
jgi:hypothetical protein